MRNEVQPDSQVHALLLPIDAKATEAQLHLGQLADALLLRIRYAVLCGVVPVDTEQREAQACSAWSTSACRSEEHTSELQSLMRISYAVFCLKKKKKNIR